MTGNQKVYLYCLLLLVSLVDLLLDLVLEAALGYAGAIGTSLMDELASLNERCDSSVVDVKMEDLDRRVLALVDEGIRDHEAVRMMRVEERERNERLTERAVELLTSRVRAKHTRRVSVKVWVVGLCSSGVCVGRIQRSQQQ